MFPDDPHEPKDDLQQVFAPDRVLPEDLQGPEKVERTTLRTGPDHELREIPRIPTRNYTVFNKTAPGRV